MAVFTSVLILRYISTLIDYLNERKAMNIPPTYRPHTLLGLVLPVSSLFVF